MRVARFFLVVSMVMAFTLRCDASFASAPQAVATENEKSFNSQKEAAEQADADLAKARKRLKNEKAIYKTKLKALKSSASFTNKFDLLLKLGELSIDDQDYGQAIQYCSDALSIAREHDDEKKSLTRQALNALAASYVCARQFDKACPLYEELVPLIKRTGDENDSELFWVLLDLGLVYGEQHKVEERAALAPQLFSLLEKRVHQKGLNDNGQADERRLPFTVWKTETSKPECIVLCVHGLGLYSESFDSFAKTLNKENIGAFAIDVRGFGAWQLSRAQRVISPERTLHDIDGFIHLIRQYQPNTPIFLLGESMGGAIVLRYAALHENTVAGVISSVPAERRYNEGNDTLRVVLNLFKNKNKRISVAKTLSKAASVETVPKDLLTDPLIRADFSPEELIKFQLFMDATAKMSSKISTTPVLMLQGMKDKLAKPDATIEIYDNIKSEDKFLLLAGDSQHLIFEEVQTPPFVTASVLDWLRSHLNHSAVKGQSADVESPKSLTR